MQFLYIRGSGQDSFILDGEQFAHIIKARREKEGSIITVRNLFDGFLYNYKITEITKKTATLQLISKEAKSTAAKELHLGWCVIDPKNIEKSLPLLNQIGVAKITFIMCKYSQKNFKISTERLEKILINSCEQSGRTTLMQIDFCSSLKEFLQLYPESIALDFEPNTTFENENIKTLLIGCEGGFSPDERELLKSRKIISFKSDAILRSETAAISASSKILL